MEKYSKATQDFASAIADDIKKEVEDSKKDEVKAFRNAVRAARVLSDPISNIPQAIIAYGATKMAKVELQEDIAAIELFDFLMEHYKTEWIDWLPETIKKTILNGESNEIIENKIQALATCLSTDTPWLEWHIFENVGKAFNHQVPNFGLLQPLSLGECWVTMKTMEYMRDEDWSNEVLLYVATVAYTNNYVYLPEESELAPVQEHLDSFGANVLDLKMKTAESWGKIRDRDVLGAEFKETPLQVQLAKLSVAQQYMKENT